MEYSVLSICKEQDGMLDDVEKNRICWINECVRKCIVQEYVSQCIEGVGQSLRVRYFMYYQLIYVVLR